MVSATDIQNLLLAEIGDTNPPILAPLMPVVWASYADKAAIYPRLQELYAKRRCIDIVIGALRNQVTFTISGSLSLQLNQRVGYLKDRRAETQTEIDKLEETSRANRTPVIAPLAATTIQTPPSGAMDANDEAYRGSPYVSPRNTSF